VTVAVSPPSALRASDMAAAVDAETPTNSRLFIVRPLLLELYGQQRVRKASEFWTPWMALLSIRCRGQ
jgi:hypothetical protein